MAHVFDVLTPFNTVPCFATIAAGLQSMHGSFIRQNTDGQLPMVNLNIFHNWF